MKTTLTLLAALATSALAGQPVLVRITPEALTKLQQGTPMTRLEKPAATTQVARPTEQSIIKQSMILHDGKNWTLVPKGAVVFLPEAMKSRVDAKPVGRLLPFAEFLTNNRSWITTNEVSFDQAAGTEPLPAERAAFWSKQDKVVIAVHQSGPISVTVGKADPTITQR
jgi:hypothetical protein